MPDRKTTRRVAFAATGVANLASIMAAFRRAGAEPYLAADPEELSDAPFAVVPGVGAFGAAMAALKAAGMDEAIKARIACRASTMGVCAGMQLFFDSSEESPGVAGMGIVPGAFKRFSPSLPVPQLGWNRVWPDDPDQAERSSVGDEPKVPQGLIRRGWAYFANSYRLTEAPAAYSTSLAEYGETFVAAVEGPGILLCQFHPELSGPWGLALIERWLGSTEGGVS
jgi:imidazole glycerol phosphate synthase glutamine amidotransferase subunit